MNRTIKGTFYEIYDYTIHFKKRNSSSIDFTIKVSFASTHHLFSSKTKHVRSKEDLGGRKHHTGETSQDIIVPSKNHNYINFIF